MLACAAGSGATTAAHAPPRPQVHYTMTTHRFAVADPGRSPDERSMARDVEWAYPVFTDTRDPATPALNAWARRESLKLLLGDVHGEDRLPDAQVIAQAVADQAFIDNGVDQAVVTPDSALGRLRGLLDNGETMGGSHPYHTLSSPLYSLDRRAEIHVVDLFKPDDDGALEELYAAQPEAACPGQSFAWGQASLPAIDTLAFEYPYEPGHNPDGVDCTLLVIRSPKVTRLLKSPRSLRPAFELVDDTPREPVHHGAKRPAVTSSAPASP